ncbi:hypothetical protein [Treponema brennaborense]|uniref:hypothetical protein n=1 Tax=Treponema brennaborense TaxID=81028 RepID=UPI00031797FE|nr:hypothetical protein [Treponema brennaborense]
MPHNPHTASAFHPASADESAPSEKEYRFSASGLEAELPLLAGKGVTKLTVHDPGVTSSKERLLRFLEAAYRHAPDVFYTVYLDDFVVDRDVCAAFARLYCSLQIGIPFLTAQDKKRLARKADILNASGLVFGFETDIACGNADTVKLFRERLDFAVSLYPNHLDFPQLEARGLPGATQYYAAQDIVSAAAAAFACTVFYSAGRAVPWFLSVLKPLRITPARFFADFAEWLRCNNCDRETGFDPGAAGHAEIERMQLHFLHFKYEEKRVAHLLPVVNDVVRLNGAFSRLAGEREECELELSFHPDDLGSPYASDIVSFSENVCMESCRVKIYTAYAPDGEPYPDCKII